MVPVSSLSMALPVPCHYMSFEESEGLPKAACEKGDEHFVALLVRARADPLLSDAAGLTAFDLLRRRGFPDGQIVQLLNPPVVAGDAGSTGATCDTAEAASP